MPATTAPIDPATTALLLMDLQSGIVGSLPGADDLVARTAHTLAAARAAGLTVGYVRVALTDAEFDAVPATHAFAAYASGNRAALYDDAPTTQIVEPLTPQPGDLVVRKIRVGAFSTTDLDAQLQAKGITTLVLTGLATSGVVLSTVRDAADHDYRVIVISDLVADRDPQVHEVLTTKVFPKQSDVITAAEFETLLEGSDHRA